MANQHRGEIKAHFNEQDYTLCLTLGALAQLEDVFEAGDMLSIAERFATGRISATDCIKIIGIGLRAAGHEVSDEMVASFKSPDGAAGFVQVVAALLEATFGVEKSRSNKVCAEKIPHKPLSQTPVGQSVKKNSRGKQVRPHP